MGVMAEVDGTLEAEKYGVSPCFAFEDSERGGCVGDALKQILAHWLLNAKAHFGPLI
jgi:hypothetical protein